MIKGLQENERKRVLTTDGNMGGGVHVTHSDVQLIPHPPDDHPHCLHTPICIISSPPSGCRIKIRSISGRTSEVFRCSRGTSLSLSLHHCRNPMSCIFSRIYFFFHPASTDLNVREGMSDSLLIPSKSTWETAKKREAERSEMK